jgi:hypothetical protein
MNTDKTEEPREPRCEARRGVVTTVCGRIPKGGQLSALLRQRGGVKITAQRAKYVRNALGTRDGVDLRPRLLRF